MNSGNETAVEIFELLQSLSYVTILPWNVTDVSNTTALERTNTTAQPPRFIIPSYPLPSAVFLWLITLVFSLVTICGNVLVILAFVIEPGLRQASNYLILSLAVSDFIIGLEGYPILTFYVTTSQFWTLGPILCNLWLVLDYTLCLVSIFTVFLITVDRYMSVCQTARYRRWQSPRKTVAIIIASWTVPLVLFSLLIFAWEILAGYPSQSNQNYACYAPFIDNAYLNMAMYLCYYWVIVVTMIGLYHGIYRAAQLVQKRAEMKEKQNLAMAALQRCMAQMGVGMIMATQERTPTVTLSRSPVIAPKSVDRFQRQDSGYSTGDKLNNNTHTLSLTCPRISENQDSPAQPLNTAFPPRIPSPVSFISCYDNAPCFETSSGGSFTSACPCADRVNRIIVRHSLFTDSRTSRLSRASERTFFTAVSGVSNQTYCTAAENNSRLSLSSPEDSPKRTPPSLCSSATLSPVHEIDHDSLLAADLPLATIPETVGDDLISMCDGMGYTRALAKAEEFGLILPEPEEDPFGNFYDDLDDDSDDDKTLAYLAETLPRCRETHLTAPPVTQKRPNSGATKHDRRSRSIQSSLSSSFRRSFMRGLTGSSNYQAELRKRASKVFANSGDWFAQLFDNAAFFGRHRRKRPKSERRARKAFRTITIILGSFVILWSPYFLLATLVGFCKTCVSATVFIISYYMCYVNSSINPFCYALANRQFRATFGRFLHGNFKPSTSKKPPVVRNEVLITTPATTAPRTDAKRQLSTLSRTDFKELTKLGMMDER